MNATEISRQAMQLSMNSLPPAEDIEGRLTRWRLVHEQMTDTLAQASRAIDFLQDERDMLLEEVGELRANGCPVGPLRRFLKSIWTR